VESPRPNPVLQFFRHLRTSGGARSCASKRTCRLHSTDRHLHLEVVALKGSTGSGRVSRDYLCFRHDVLAFADMSQVIYARVPETVKADVEEYADQNAVSLSAAVVDLLQRGLAAAGEERSIANLEAKLARMNGEKVTLEANLHVALTRSARCAHSPTGGATTVGSCPKCRAPITGLDLLGRGLCGKCQASLLELLAPKDQRRNHSSMTVLSELWSGHSASSSLQRQSLDRREHDGDQAGADRVFSQQLRHWTSSLSWADAL